MKTFTVCFFGHRQLSDSFNVEKHLESILHDIIMTKEYIEFLVGRDGEFDQIATSAIKRAIEKISYGNTSLILVLPYERVDYRDNRESYEKFYDEVEICQASSEAHYKAAIEIRNREIIRRSDLVICNVEHLYGGAFKAMSYAEKIGKQIVYLKNYRNEQFLF